MVSLPLWLAGVLAFFYVLGTFLSGVGAVYASRGNRKTEDIRVTINGRLDERIEEAYKRGLAEGKLEATTRTPVVVMEHPAPQLGTT